VRYERHVVQLQLADDGIQIAGLVHGRVGIFPGLVRGTPAQEIERDDTPRRAQVWDETVMKMEIVGEPVQEEDRWLLPRIIPRVDPVPVTIYPHFLVVHRGHLQSVGPAWVERQRSFRASCTPSMLSGRRPRPHRDQAADAEAVLERVDRSDAQLACHWAGAAVGSCWAAMIDPTTDPFAATAVARQLAKLPVMPVPAGVRYQPVDADDVAARLVELSLGKPSGLVPDIGGPRVYELTELLRSYLRASHRHRLLMPVRLPGKAARAVRAGANLAPEQAVGHRTWEGFLASGCVAHRPVEEGTGPDATAPEPGM
jgi:hypothetical protein